METVPVKDIRSSAVFGKRREPHTVIIARGDDIRHFTVRPWMAAVCGSVIAACALGYLLATTYLVLRDDLIGATVARQARLQQAYEDRISSLRAQVDRITSRQLLDQQLMESKVAELINRQEELSQRNGRIMPLLERVGAADASPTGVAPAPAKKPELDAAMAPVNAYAAQPPSSVAASMLSRFVGRAASSDTELSVADRADRLFVNINNSLRDIESQQITRIRTLARSANETADAIVGALGAAGLTVDPDYGSTDVGGPLLPLPRLSAFDAEVEELDEALLKLDGVRTAASRLPIANPAPGRPVTSGFGVRKDPLIGRPAFHGGLDFRAAEGAPVRATGAGTVVKAGWSGGYGRMVEIRHGDGLATRYAHMSEIKVVEGQEIEAGMLLGLAGSSGRSTGPHIHYEVRRDGKPVNPTHYIRAGRAVGELL